MNLKRKGIFEFLSLFKEIQNHFFFFGLFNVFRKDYMKSFCLIEYKRNNSLFIYFEILYRIILYLVDYINSNKDVNSRLGRESIHLLPSAKWGSSWSAFSGLSLLSSFPCFSKRAFIWLLEKQAFIWLPFHSSWIE